MKDAKSSKNAGNAEKRAQRAALDGGQTRSAILETDAIRRQRARQGAPLDLCVPDRFVDAAILRPDLWLRMHGTIPLCAGVLFRLARVAGSRAGELDVLAAAGDTQGDRKRDAKPRTPLRSPQEAPAVVRAG